MKEITFYKKLEKSEKGQKYLELIREKEHCSWKVRISGFERHHILPRAMGGKDDDSNLVKLTSFEHVLAHYYLALAVPCYQTLRTMYILSNMTVQKLTDLEKIELAQLEHWGKLREEAMRLPTIEGRMCINNGKRKKYIQPEEFQEYAIEGWKLGNLPTTQGYVTVTDGTCDRRVPADRFETLLQEGWKEGSVKRGMPSGQKGKHVGERNWMSNGVLEKQVRVCDQEEYLKMGWHYGKIPWSLETRKKFSYNLKNRPDFIGKSEKGRLRRRKTGLGRIWMNLGTEDRWVTPDIAEELKSQGWIRGRSSKGLRRTIHKEGERDKIVPQSELNTYLINGWNIGRSRKGKLRTVFRGNEIRMVPAESLEEFINQGYR